MQGGLSGLEWGQGRKRPSHQQGVPLGVVAWVLGHQGAQVGRRAGVFPHTEPRVAPRPAAANGREAGAQAALDVPPEDGARAEPGPPGLRRPLVADGATGPGVGLAALGPRAAHAQTLPPACSPGSLGSGPSRHGEPSAGSGQGERVTKAHVRVTWGGARGRAPAQVWPGVRAAEGANQGRTAGREAAPGRGGAGLPAVGFLGGVTGRHGGL